MFFHKYAFYHSIQRGFFFFVENPRQICAN